MQNVNFLKRGIVFEKVESSCLRPTNIVYIGRLFVDDITFVIVLECVQIDNHTV